MSEEAKLVLAVDATQVKQASTSLNDLAAAGKRAESSTNNLTTAVSKEQQSMNKIAATMKQQSNDSVALSGDIQRLLNKYDPLGTKLRALESDFAALNAAASGGDIGAKHDIAVDKTYAALNAEITKTKSLMGEAGVAVDGGADSMDNLNFSSNRARQQLMLLGKDVMTGDLSNVPNRLMTMAVQSNALSLAMTPIGLAVIGITAALGAGAYAWYKWGKDAEAALLRSSELVAAMVKIAEDTKQMTQLEKIAALRKQENDLLEKSVLLQERLRLIQRESLTWSNPKGAKSDGSDDPSRRQQLMESELFATNEAIANLRRNAADIHRDLDKKSSSSASKESAFVKQLEKESEVVGKTSREVKEYEAAMLKLSVAQRAQVLLTLDMIDARTAEKDLLNFINVAMPAQVDAIQAATEKELEHAAALGLTKEAVADLEIAKINENAAAKDRLADLFHEIDPAIEAGYLAQAAALRDLAKAKGGTKDSAKTADDKGALSKSLLDLQKALDPEKARNFGNELAGAFGRAGDAIQGMTNAYRSYAKTQKETADAQKVLNKAAESGIDVSREQALLSRRNAADQIGAYGDMAGAAKGFFNEGSDGYKVLQQTEQVYRAFQFAASVAAMVQAGTETSVIVAADGVKTASGMVAGAARFFAQSGWAGFVGVAAMVALIASMGGRSKGSGGGYAPGAFESKAANKGTGSVLGDSAATSKSLSNSLEALVDLDMRQLTNSTKMIALLTSINIAISGTTNAIVRGLIGTGISPFTTSSGIAFGAQTVGGASTDLNAQEYSTDTLLLNLTGGRVGTYFSELENAVKVGLQDVIRNLADAVSGAALSLGASQAQVDKLKDMQIELGKLDFFGKTGKEINDLLNAVFSKLGDSMAKFIIPGVERFQIVGEGLFETLVRVASWNEYANATFASLGLSVRRTGAAAVDANIAIINMFGGIENATDAIGDYTESFFSAAEKQAMAMAALNAQFAALGVSTPSSLQAFRQLVEGLDLSTTAGQAMFAALMNMSGAFADAVTTATDIVANNLAFFNDNFLTAAEQLVPSTNAVKEAFAKLNIAVPSSRDAFAALVKSADLSTASGRSMYEALLDIAPAFYRITDAVDALNEALDPDKFSSLTDYLRAAGTSNPGGSLPGFASGNPYVAQDMVANIHQGEMIVDAQSASLMRRYGVGSGNDALVSEIRALRNEVAQLRNEAQSSAVNASRAARVLERWDGNGTPPTREE